MIDYSDISIVFYHDEYYIVFDIRCYYNTLEYNYVIIIFRIH